MRDKLNESRLKPIEFVRTHYRAVAEAGCTIETVQKPEYLAHVAKQLRPDDEITVVAEDGSFRIDLVVVDTAPQWAKTRILQKWDWAEDALNDEGKPEATDEYSTVYKGPHDRWCIQRNKDEMIVQKGILDKVEAHKAAKNYTPKSV